MLGGRLSRCPSQRERQREREGDKKAKPNETEGKGKSGRASLSNCSAATKEKGREGWSMYAFGSDACSII